MTTLATLNLLIDHINEITNSPKTPWTRKEGGGDANIGNYHLSQAYGGVCLHRMSSAGGGVNTPLSSGHDTKKNLETQLRAFINGIESI